MAYKMTKQGTTNEFICEVADDLNNIPKDQVNFGSMAVVIEGGEIFIANSKKQWCSMTPVDNSEYEELPK